VNAAPKTPVAPDGHHAESIAVAAERRWAMVVGLIMAVIVLLMIFAGLHWASMPPSRVETVNVKTLHLKGEFVEGNLGTAVDPDGKVTVRLVAQQYSFEPQCIVVPQGMPVTFRGTSADAVHGFIVGTTNANTMLIPGFVATFTTTFNKTGEQLMPCHEYCGIGHEAMWAKVEVLPREDFMARARNTERMTCVPR
jgi:cytochrome c oxidase subunit 2